MDKLLVDPSCVVDGKLGLARLAAERLVETVVLNGNGRAILAFTSKTKAKQFCRINRRPTRSAVEISNEYDFYGAFAGFLADGATDVIVDWTGPGDKEQIQPLAPLLKRIKEAIDAGIRSAGDKDHRQA